MNAHLVGSSEFSAKTSLIIVNFQYTNSQFILHSHCDDSLLPNCAEYINNVQSLFLYQAFCPIRTSNSVYSQNFQPKGSFYFCCLSISPKIADKKNSKEGYLHQNFLDYINNAYHDSSTLS